MESWLVVFLGVIALASIIQVVFLVVLARLGLQGARRARVLQERARVELRVPLGHLSEATRNVKEMSTLLAGEARELREGARTAAVEIRAAKDDMARAVRTPVVHVSALAKAVGRAIETFRRTPFRPPTVRQGAEYTPPTPSDWARA